MKPEKFESDLDLSTTLYFSVEIEGVVQAYFTSVQGLESETEVETYREGGQNGFEHKFPKGTKYPPLVLKRGLSYEDLWAWYEEVTLGIVKRRDCTITLMRKPGEDLRSWVFSKCYPVKWVGPELSADRSLIAIETLELVHKGFICLNWR